MVFWEWKQCHLSLIVEIHYSIFRFCFYNVVSKYLLNAEKICLFLENPMLLKSKVLYCIVLVIKYNLDIRLIKFVLSHHKVGTIWAKRTFFLKKPKKSTWNWIHKKSRGRSSQNIKVQSSRTVLRPVEIFQQRVVINSGSEARKKPYPIPR